MISGGGIKSTNSCQPLRPAVFDLWCEITRDVNAHFIFWRNEISHMLAMYTSLQLEKKVRKVLDRGLNKTPRLGNPQAAAIQLRCIIAIIGAMTMEVCYPYSYESSSCRCIKSQ